MKKLVLGTFVMTGLLLASCGEKKDTVVVETPVDTVVTSVDTLVVDAPVVDTVVVNKDSVVPVTPSTPAEAQ